MTAASPETDAPAKRKSINHAEQVGNVEDLGTLESMPERTNVSPPRGSGRSRQFNPFDALVVETYETGKPRLAVADDLNSAKVLIRRAAAHARLGVDVVPTVAPDGRAALAYLARVKRPKVPDAPESAAAPAEASTAPDDAGLEAYDDDDESEVAAAG